MSISYFQNDELPVWEPTVELNGETPDFTVGYTFKAKARLDGTTGDLALDKTAGIFGFTEGRVQVQWAPGELNIAPGLYDLQLTAKRISDDREWTVGEMLIIKPRF